MPQLTDEEREWGLKALAELDVPSVQTWLTLYCTDYGRKAVLSMYLLFRARVPNAEIAFQMAVSHVAELRLLTDRREWTWKDRWPLGLPIDQVDSRLVPDFYVKGGISL